jgi:hypothetical protein
MLSPSVDIYTLSALARVSIADRNLKAEPHGLIIKLQDTTM